MLLFLNGPNTFCNADNRPQLLENSQLALKWIKGVVETQFLLSGLLLHTQPLYPSEQHTRAHLEFSSHFVGPAHTAMHIFAGWKISKVPRCTFYSTFIVLDIYNFCLPLKPFKK